MDYPILAPAINETNLNEIQEKVKIAERLGVEEIHFDVMCGKYVPQKAGCSAGRAEKLGIINAPLRAHLMVKGCYRAAFEWDLREKPVIFHSNAFPSWKKNKNRFVPGFVGVALNPDEPVEKLWPHIDDINHVLIMAGPPGLSGQEFDWNVLKKYKKLKTGKGRD